MNKWHKANKPNQPGVLNIEADSSLINTYRLLVAYLVRESDQ